MLEINKLFVLLQRSLKPIFFSVKRNFRVDPTRKTNISQNGGYYNKNSSSPSVRDEHPAAPLFAARGAVVNYRPSAKPTAELGSCPKIAPKLSMKWYIQQITAFLFNDWNLLWNFLSGNVSRESLHFRGLRPPRGIRKLCAGGGGLGSLFTTPESITQEKLGNKL